MEALLKKIAIYLLLCVLMYLFGAFYSVTWDISEWGEGTRGFIVASFCVMLYALIGITIESK